MSNAKMIFFFISLRYLLPSTKATASRMLYRLFNILLDFGLALPTSLFPRPCDNRCCMHF